MSIDERNLFRVLAVALCCLVLILLLSGMYSLCLRRKFRKTYRIKSLPPKIKVKRRISKFRGNYFSLAYPRWEHAKADGTMDRRYKNNRVIWGTCQLFVGKFKLVSKRPEKILAMVVYLRSHNVDIDLCDEEILRKMVVEERHTRFAKAHEIDSIVEYFKDEPSRFEALCAELFEKMGYIAQLTPPTNDGGYDIILTKNGEKSIVECKCYSAENKIGRPLIQKLVGANEVVGASHLVFVTTSSFTNEATVYAHSVGVELLSGTDLFRLLKQYGMADTFSEPNNGCKEIPASEYQLSLRSLKSHIPLDIYNHYILGN